MRDRIVRDIEESIAVKQELLKKNTELLERACQWVAECIRSGHKLILFGNGGSAADCQHIAAEFVGRFLKERKAVPALALTSNTSTLTAIGNDYGFDRVYERQIEAFAAPGDVAIAISTSGNSPNVLKGIAKSRELGLRVIGMTGISGGKMKDACDLLIAVPSAKTARVQEAHSLIGHIISERADELI